MSNYTPVLAYAPKDSLAHGDPLKAIKGAQLDAELQAISAAIASKVDSAGPAQQTIARNKTAATSKTSTVTLALDPHLQYNVPGAGTYRFEIWFCLTAGNGGITVSNPYSGTFDTTLSYCTREGQLNSSAFHASTPLTFTTFTSSVATSGDYVTLKGVLVATSSGTFGVQWSQSVSNVSPLTVQSGYLLMTQIS